MSSKTKEWTVLSMLEWATDFFEKKGIPDPRHSIEWLLAETLDIKRLDLYLKFDRPLSQSELDTLRPLVKRRAQHEPLQYIIGYTDFMNARLSVTEDVLIPRIETEQLVEIILDDFPDKEESRTAIDLGTGSGCIPIALKMERPHWQVSGIDISEEALALARKNAEQNEVEVTFGKGDILDPASIPLSGQPDLIISNPPYITPAEEEVLEPQVREYEPHRALFVDDMEQMYGQIIRFAEQQLPQGGMLYLEIHEHYSDEIRALFEGSSWRVQVKKDYDKKPRFIVAEIT